MNLCSDGHDEICYESRNCPFCEHMNEASEREEAMQSSIDRLNDEVAQLTTALRIIENAKKEYQDPEPLTSIAR